MIRILACLLLFGGAAVADAVVPTRAIRPQTILTAADLTLISKEMPGAVARIEDAVGREARVALYPGRAITSGDIAAPAVIERNQIVQMRFRAGPLEIVSEGRALARARPGERVRVINLDSRLTVSGTVTEAGWVRMGP
ncbi:MAG: flagellar basal body P-ring formation chaperone FlgA [Pseudomonadota bacterium]